MKAATPMTLVSAQSDNRLRQKQMENYVCTCTHRHLNEHTLKHAHVSPGLMFRAQKEINKDLSLYFYTVQNENIDD